MGIKDLKPTRGKFKQGYYIPVNPEKYIGDLQKIIFRSSWEYKFCRYCDNSSRILKWGSEPIPIPYISPLDNRRHTYHVDFYIRIVDIQSVERDFLIEIKPKYQTVTPKKPETRLTEKRMMDYNSSMRTYITNMAKWRSAREYVASLGYEFMILTEDFFDGKNLAIM
jgi:hypothetical protein